MIADCARLGYLKETDYVVDPTYGRGTWWKVWAPTLMAASDLYEDERAPFDFTNLPYADDTFDAGVFDPPYVSQGGRDTSTVPHLTEGRYGLYAAPRTPAGVQELVNAGLTEVSRVVKPRGYILCKVKDYVSSGRYVPAQYLTTHHAVEKLALELVDTLHYLTKSVVNSQTTQVHARRNHSTLLVFRV
jgi:tRNA G10  N-methylase Trm11